MEIELSRGKKAIVDAVDYEAMNKYKWSCSTLGYAVRRDPSSRKRIIWMHREIANTPSGMFTDHINGNRLDNRRCNLRVCTLAENCQNKNAKRGNRFRGLHQLKRTGKWQVTVGKNRIKYHIGTFDTAEQGALAYNEAVTRLHGKFAKLNEVQI